MWEGSGQSKGTGRIESNRAHLDRTMAGKANSGSIQTTLEKHSRQSCNPIRR